MPARSSWKGFIRLSLVSVPVKAYTATASSAEVRLNQLHKETMNRIRYVKTDPERGEVSSDEIVQGYEYAKGQYVLIDPEEVAKLRPKSDRSVNVQGFFAPEALDEIYETERSLYLVPDGPIGQKPYELLRRGMAEENVRALGQVVLSGREQLVMLRPLDRLIVMTVLSHDAKVKKPESFEDELIDVEIGKPELALTKTLIQASKLEPLDYARFKDEYVEKLTQVIQIKIDGQEVVQVADPETPQIVNLMEALKASVEAAQSAAAGATAPAPRTRSAARAPAKARTKMAPSARTSTKKPARKKSG